MPSPGTSAIAVSIGGKSYSVEGNYTTNFDTNGEFVSKLANAMHAGWTSSSPTTATTMSSAFTAEFSGYLAGTGLLFINSIAQGIDAEIADWVASWNSTSGTHTYPVNAASIVSRILAIAPFNSNGVVAISEAVATAFMSGFEQEAG